MSKKDDPQSSGFKADPNAWMATLSDLIFLLITFFVLLITMSSLDAKKVKDAFGLFDEADGVLSFSDTTTGSKSIVPSVLDPISAMTSMEMESADEGELTLNKQRATKEILDTIATGINGTLPAKTTIGTLRTLAKRTGGEIHVEQLSDGTAVDLPGRLLFPEGKTEIDEKGEEILKSLSTILKLWGGDIDVIAYWSWHHGPEILGKVVASMERNWIKGEKIHPELSPVAKRTIRFVLRQGNES
ncbi:MAG: hypothetical protein GY854_28430 [Deltaproteobacteria bacterium]|nr:hypothetical protein [Deltaproteobacteria bacterium]